MGEREREKGRGANKASTDAYFFLPSYLFTPLPEKAVPRLSCRQTAGRRHVAETDKENTERLCTNTQTTDVRFSGNIWRNCCKITF